MVAGLHRFGTDFGQGEHDRQFFQRDEELASYLGAKRRAPAARHVIGGHDEPARRACTAALAWMRETLAREAPQALEACAKDREARDELDAIARAIQEDFAVLCRGADGLGRAVLLDVRFPSGWRPERLANANFSAIHAPVPGFAQQQTAAKSMVEAMIERGPFVRFVWTLSPDPELDHHPEVLARCAWTDVPGVWLRVERQITVPLPEAAASVFLIRTYQYPFSELSREQRSVVLDALSAMPPEIRAYKNLPTRDVVEALISAAPAAQ